MNTRLIITISAIAVTILIIIQVYVIREYFSVKSRGFDLQYSYAVSKTLSGYDAYNTNFPFDSVNYIFNRIALNYLSQPDLITDVTNQIFLQNILRDFSNILHRYERNKDRITKNLKDLKLDTIFDSNFIINEIAFLDFDSIIPVYKEENQTAINLYQEKNGFFVKSYNAEGDYYLVRFDYYVDFTRKSDIIIREMKGLLILVTITIITILLAFAYTIYSFNRQKRLTDLKDDFIDHITHEFKTPLSTISVAVSSLKQDVIRKNADKIDEIAGIIGKQNHFLARMIDHVIEVSQSERNQLIPVRKNLLFKKFIQRVIEDFRLENHHKTVNIFEAYSINDNLLINLDSLQFSRVVYNILGNSVKYSQEDVRVTVRASASDVLKIEFIDNGIGIPKNELEQVFSKFYRVTGHSVPAVKGLGLGLYLVKLIVEAHDGTVVAESEQGKGTTIIIRLPLNKKEE